ncbi:MAG: replicative DNA helicase [Armatimonadota bacterium]
MVANMPSGLLQRIPPQSLEAERAALGAMLLERDAIAGALEVIRPEDFYREGHQILCRGIFALYTKNEPVDLITLGEWLTMQEQLEAVGGTHYLTAMMSEVPTAAGIGHYCAIVKEKARRRELIRMADRLMHDAYTEEEADLVGRYQRELDRIEEGLVEAELGQLWEWEESAVREMQEADELGHDTGVRTNLQGLNRILDPFRPGDIIIVAGRPSMGKSVLAMQMALAACDQGKKALFLSIEMGSQALATRALIAESGVPSWKAKMLHYRRANAEEVYAPFLEAMERHREFDLVVSRPRRLTPNDVLVLGRRKKHHGGLDLVVVDYLQLMTSNDQHKETYERVTAISRELKETAVALKVPIVVVSQLSREVERRSPRRPMMSDLRESGQVEQDADTILLLYRPGYYDADNFAENRKVDLQPGDKNSTEIIIAKQRNGQTGAAWTYFELERSRFYDIEDKPEK